MVVYDVFSKREGGRDVAQPAAVPGGSSLDEAISRVRRLSTEPVRAIFLTRALNAAAWLVQALDTSALSEAAAQPTDYSFLLRALEAPEVVEALARDDPLAEARLAGLRSKTFLLHAEGGAVPVEEAAAMLGLTRQAVDRRRRAGKLIGLTMGRRGYLYPAWQFGEHGTIPGLEETLAALDSFGPWSQVSWFIGPNTRLGSRSPLTMLREGQIEPVVRAAQLYGEQGG
jgi:hypothetical protein